jgi:hypothetical protein
MAPGTQLFEGQVPAAVCVLLLAPSMQVAGQSEALRHWTHPLDARHKGVAGMDPQLVWLPATQALPLQVPAAVNVWVTLHCAGMVTEQSDTVPAVQVFEPLQVDAAVNMVPLHMAPGQSPLPLHCTHMAFAMLHLGVAGIVEQSVVAPVVQVFAPVQVDAGVSTLPVHEAPAQSPLPLHWTQPLAMLQTWLVVAQLVVVGVGQVPVPLQLTGGVYVLPLQLGVPHIVVFGQS